MRRRRKNVGYNSIESNLDIYSLDHFGIVFIRYVGCDRFRNKKIWFLLFGWNNKIKREKKNVECWWFRVIQFVRIVVLQVLLYGYLRQLRFYSNLEIDIVTVMDLYNYEISLLLHTSMYKTVLVARNVVRLKRKWQFEQTRNGNDNCWEFGICV